MTTFNGLGHVSNKYCSLLDLSSTKSLEATTKCKVVRIQQYSYVQKLSHRTQSQEILRTDQLKPGGFLKIFDGAIFFCHEDGSVNAQGRDNRGGKIDLHATSSVGVST